MLEQGDKDFKTGSANSTQLKKKKPTSKCILAKNKKTRNLGREK